MEQASLSGKSKCVWQFVLKLGPEGLLGEFVLVKIGDMNSTSNIFEGRITV